MSPHRVPSPHTPGPCSRRAMWLLAGVLPLLWTACATTSGNLGADCDRGDMFACSQWGHQLLQQGEPQQAENAFARSCENGSIDDCTRQGRLMLERGELDSAEPPLLKGYEAESQPATQALMDLYQTRRAPGDEARVRQMAWDVPAIDKPDREVMFWWRPSPTGDLTYALAYSFQPMVFWSRRMSLGLHYAGNDEGPTEFNASVGYQHFLTPEIVPYGTLLIGGAFQKRSFNVGVEAGVKVCLGSIGHLNLGGGSSVGSPLHASIGIGINSLPVDFLLYLAAHAH